MILRDYQSSTVSSAQKALEARRNTVVVSPTGSGKCLGKGTPVLLHDGSVKNVEDVSIGDILVGPDSEPRIVKSITNGEEELFRVIPAKGDPYVVNRSHILSLRITGNQEVNGLKPGEIVNISVNNYLLRNKTFKHCAKGWRTGVSFSEKQKRCSIIPPYILGVWLGDGSNHNVNAFTSPDDEIVEELKRYSSTIGLHLRTDNIDRCPMHHITSGAKGKLNQFTSGIRALGINGNKNIPFEFKTGSRFDRLEILAGILDTDGYSHGGGYDYISKDKQLAEDVVFVARSLGLAAYRSTSMKKAQGWNECKEYHRVSISGDCSVIPCRVERKKAFPRLQKKNVLNTGITVESIGTGEYFGFEISGNDRLFLLGDFTVTHNTVMLSALAGRFNGAKTLILQHREELVRQNSKTFAAVNPGWARSFVTAKEKDFSGDAVFAMVQTLCRRTEEMPAFDLVIADECHHSIAPSWFGIISAARERNQESMLAGFTATPERGDGKGLSMAFDNVSSVIPIRDLIKRGYLVQPKTFVKDIGVKDQLSNVRKKGDDFDMDAVEAIMNHKVINDEVVRHWADLCPDRKTIVFCSTVQHAEDVADAFRRRGLSVGVLTGDMPKKSRKGLLRMFESGEVQVMTNVAVATEGYDCPSISCVILLRPCSYKSTMIQMVGRGLRVWPEGVKTDCVVMDFGNSILTHGDIEAGGNIDGRLSEKQDWAPVTCAECGGEIPADVDICPLCGAEQKSEPVETESGEEQLIYKVGLTEFDLMDASPFRWIDLFDSGKVYMATGFDAWVVVASLDGNVFTAIGGGQGRKIRKLAMSSKLQAMTAADDYMREIETSDAAKKSKGWMKQPATEKQCAWLHKFGYDTGSQMFPKFNKYEAAAAMTFKFAQKGIESILFSGARVPV